MKEPIAVERQSVGAIDDGQGYPAEHDPQQHREVVAELAKRSGISSDQASQLVAKHGAEDIDQLLNYAKILISN